MALPSILREILVCPRCRGELQFHEEQKEIHCLTCQLAYPIEDDVPTMLPQEARPLGEVTPERK